MTHDTAWKTELIRHLERFVSGEVASADFEAWAYAHHELAQVLGEDAYLDLLSSNFADEDEIGRIRSILADAIARSAQGSGCSQPATHIVNVVIEGGNNEKLA